MKINDDHLYHGAALTQIAEHERFTAINAFKTDGVPSRSGFRINDDIAVYLKYAAAPKGSYNEYPFTFRRDHLTELQRMARATASVYLALVCVKDRQICCLSLAELTELVERRRRAKGADEDQTIVLVTLPAGSKFRVYVSVPGERKKTLGQPLKIARNSFPDRLFG